MNMINVKLLEYPLSMWILKEIIYFSQTMSHIRAYQTIEISFYPGLQLYVITGSYTDIQFLQQ